MRSASAPGSATLFLTATLIWGSTWLAIKYQLGAVAPQNSVAYRFAAAGVLLIVWCLVTRRSLRFSGRDHGFLALQGATFFGFNYVAIYLAEQYVTSGLLAVLFSTIVFMNPIGMRLVYRTPLTARMLIAAALGVAGVAALFLPDLAAVQSDNDAGRGIAYGLAGTLLASVGNTTAVRNQRHGIPIFPGTAWAMLYGSIAVAIASSFQGIGWTFDPRPAYVFSFAYLVLAGSIAAFGAYLTLLKKIGAGPSAFIGVATPVIAMTLSSFLEGYRWTTVAALGVALAVVGNVIALRPFTRKKAL
ncbi:MAG TPA: DMT family transporter [Casimicrobiaceae bacterium]|nr:DMT family transporter [Casimicrobiaceae bacterium]